MRYPNLDELIKYHPYSICTFAGFADVTTELLETAVAGDGELTGEEFAKIAWYSGIPVGVLRCPYLIMMEKDNRRHREMIKGLNDRLYIIWEKQKQGSKEADGFMKYYGRTCLVNLELAFLDKRGTYAWYLGAKERVDQCLLFIKCEERKSRGLVKKGSI